MEHSECTRISLERLRVPHWLLSHAFPAGGYWYFKRILQVLKWGQMFSALGSFKSVAKNTLDDRSGTYGASGTYLGLVGNNHQLVAMISISSTLRFMFSCDFPRKKKGTG